MIVVLEGADGGGKTTLAAAIRSRIHCHLLTSSGPPTNIDQIIDELNWLAEFPRRHLLVCDRHRLISEPIYGPILRQRNLLAEPRSRYNDMDVADEAQLIVYCRPSLESAILNVTATKQQQLAGVPDQLSRIIVAYDEWYETASRSRPDSFMRYSYENPTDLEDVIEAIKERRNG